MTYHELLELPELHLLGAAVTAEVASALVFLVNAGPFDRYVVVRDGPGSCRMLLPVGTPYDPHESMSFGTGPVSVKDLTLTGLGMNEARYCDRPAWPEEAAPIQGFEVYQARIADITVPIVLAAWIRSTVPDSGLSTS